jgi:hypothetical protein
MPAAESDINVEQMDLVFTMDASRAASLGEIHVCVLSLHQLQPLNVARILPRHASMASATS